MMTAPQKAAAAREAVDFRTALVRVGDAVLGFDCVLYGPRSLLIREPLAGTEDVPSTMLGLMRREPPEVVFKERFGMSNVLEMGPFAHQPLPGCIAKAHGRCYRIDGASVEFRRGIGWYCAWYASEIEDAT